MAQHYIYDDENKNQIKMVLNDEEYEQYKREKRLGCGLKTIFAAIVIFVIAIYGVITQEEGNSPKKVKKTETIEVQQRNPSTRRSNNSVQGNGNKIAEPEPYVEDVPLPEENAEPADLQEESAQEIETSTSLDESEQEQQLTRKERRALRKAQKKLEKEERRRRKLAEKEQKIEEE